MDIILGQQFLKTFREIKFDFKENRILLINEKGEIIINGPHIEVKKQTTTNKKSDMENEKVHIINTQQQQIKYLTNKINKPNSHKARKKIKNKDIQTTEY